MAPLLVKSDLTLLGFQQTKNLNTTRILVVIDLTLTKTQANLLCVP